MANQDLISTVVKIITDVIVSAGTVFAACLIGRRQMCVEGVTKKRLESVGERKDTLNREWFAKHGQYHNYVEIRKKCLRVLKIYNFVWAELSAFCWGRCRAE